MDNDDIYFDEIKREVLPDGRIRYYAEKIVREIEIPAPGTRNELEQRFHDAAEPFRNRMLDIISKDNPYLELLEGKAPAMGGDLS